MDDFDFMKAFAGIDLLQIEAVSKAFGRGIGKLREGMIEAGMQNYEADALIGQAWSIFITSMAAIYGQQSGGKT